MPFQLKMLPSMFNGMLLFLAVWTPYEVMAGITRPTAFAHRVVSFRDSSTPAMPHHTTKDVCAPEVEVKPDPYTTKFSPQNAFFFATLSNVAYKNEKEAKGLVVGNSTCEGMGFEHFYWFQPGKNAGDSVFDAIQDTEAFVAANDDMIAVVFRGTQETSDWATNLKLSQKPCPNEWNAPSEEGGLHKGFDEGVSTIWDPARGMRDTIKKLYHEDGKSRKLFVAGHSLGGALATIAAARLCFAERINVHGIYTFGSPRVFNNQIARFFDNSINSGAKLKNKYFRCRNNNDVVPRVPITPYTHVGTEIYLDRFGQVSTNNLLDRLLGRLNSYLRGDFIEGIDDHAISEYARHFKQIIINSNVPAVEKVTSAVSDAVGQLALKIAPNAAEKNEKLKQIKARAKVIEEVKDKARAAAGGL